MGLHISPVSPDSDTRPPPPPALPYENVVTLKDSSNVFIGTLHHTGRSERKSNGTLGRLLAVSTASGVLSWEVNLAPDTQGVPEYVALPG